MNEAKHIYRIHLDTAADLFELARTAAKCKYDVTLVNGRHRLCAKSIMGVMIAKMSWDEINIEADCDCYFDFEKFIR